VDPLRTMSSGKVEVKAFRTWPENYKVPDQYKMKVPKGKGEFEVCFHFLPFSLFSFP
jgi:hypothetical protein